MEWQGELRRAQDVVCTTDGEQLVICPPDSYRPLVSIPLTAITGTEVQTAEEVGVSHIREAETPVLVVASRGSKSKRPRIRSKGRWCSAAPSEAPAAAT